MTVPTKHYTTEDQSVEKPAIALLEQLGWQHVNAYYETFGASSTLGRESKKEVFLTRYLRPALQNLNKDLPPEAIDQALIEITRDRSALHYARANREVYTLLRERVPVTFRKPDGSSVTEKLTVIDWEDPEDNDFLLVSQLWIKRDHYERRADLIAFVNGIPLVFITLNSAHNNSGDD